MPASADHPAFAEALELLERRDAVRRLHARDDTLWSDDPEHQAVARQRLGWLDVAAAPEGWPERLRRFAEDVADHGLDRTVLAGMGGSSLAPEVIAALLGQAPFDVLDSTHPVAVRRLLDDADLDRALVLISSKSGTTEETACFASRAQALVPSPGHLAAITDPGSALAAQARDAGWRDVFENPADIGGRYSALSLFGMVPAALVGADLDGLWDGAARMRDACGPDVPLAEHPGAVLGAYMGGLARAGRDKLTVLLPQALDPLGDWIEQLVAESTGKDGVGVVPVVGEPPARPGAYGDDRAFVAVSLAGTAPADVDALAGAGHPVLGLDVAGPAELGAEFLRWEVATALAGVVLGVDPFDEPNVAESKAATTEALADVAAGGALPGPEDGRLDEALAAVGPGDYVALQCYLPPDEATARALGELRVAIRDRTGAATTVGWGPRYLHSTGQLHKGGGDGVVAVQLVDAPRGGPDIPDRPYDFATLVRAQAVGDLRSLRAKGRRVTQVHVDSAAGVHGLVDAVKR